MITIFVNENGYYIAGEHIEISQKCSPAITEEGDRILPPLHHLYSIFYSALEAVRRECDDNDIIVYNDSRVIDEINGTIPSFDATCQRWRTCIQRNLIPGIKGIVLFRKRSAQYICDNLTQGQNKLSSGVDFKTRIELAETIAEVKRLHEKQRKERIINRFKDNWRNKYGKRQKQ